MGDGHDADLRLLAQGERPPFYLLALSLGAMVAVAWAQRHPSEVAGCVLINTSMRPFSPFHQRLRPRNYAALLKLASGRLDEHAREAWVLALTSRSVAAHDPLLADWVAYRRECPVSGRNALRQLLAAARFCAPPSRPATRLLVLAAAQDTLVDSRCSQRLAEHWAVPLVVHPHAGHDIPLDDGPWVAERVRQWSAAASAGTRAQTGPKS